MAELELLEYYRKMCERNILLDFQGAISQEMLVGMAELIKKKLTQDFGPSKIVKKIFSVFIEMAQNIAHYSAERVQLLNNPSDVGAGIIVITEEAQKYTITSGNLVNNDTIEEIIARCEKINNMNREELKRFYKAEINTSREKGKKGGGIGLIDIARKTGSTIRHRVTLIDDTQSFLVLSVKIEETQING